jgi:hypothetical protein
MIEHMGSMKNTALYHHLRTIPKGVLHHIHYFCNDDADFVNAH